MSLRRKLMILTALAVVLAQAAAGAVSAAFEMDRAARLRQETLVRTATVLAAAVATPLAAGDADAVGRAIAGIARIAGTPHAAVFAADGTVVAEAGVTELLSDTPEIRAGDPPLGALDLLGVRAIRAVAPAVRGGVAVGSVVLDGDASDLPAVLARAAWVSLAVTAGALVLALLASARLQARLLRPLRQLAEVMGGIAAHHDYRVAPLPAGSDEVGVLARSFNTMMSEIRDRDEGLAAHRARLESDVADRTRDLAHATAEAEAANRAKSDFLATMSHEIRTPMNGLMVMAELLAAADLPPREHRRAEVIARSGESLLAIINDILDFSKIEAGKLTLERLPVDAAAVVDQTLRVFADRARAKGLDLAALIDLPDGLCVDADPVRLGQVLGNLVGNAVKFTEAGAVTVTAERAGAGVRFAVRDTGVGIPADRIGGLFEAFEQADSTTTRRFGGTGLGLTIARRLVQAMGGDIVVESRLGEGSVFAFAVPLHAAGAPAGTPAIVRADGPRPLAVLALEGAATTAAATAALAAAGFAVRSAREAGDGEAAALILTDASGVLDRRAVGPATVVAAVTPLGETPAVDGAVDLPWPLSRADLVRLAEDVRAGRAPRSVDRPAAAPRSRFDGLRVLVADDGEVNREVARAALSAFGASVDCVEDGAAAVRAVAAGRYDLVLMDGSMPVLDGFSAARLIRAREAEEGLARLPIVAVTAHVVGAAAEAWRTAGMDGVLHKPFKLAALEAVLRAIAGDAPPAASAAGTDTSAEAAAEAGDVLVDPAPLDDLRGRPGGAVVAERVVGLFARSAEDAVRAVGRAADEGDPQAVGTAAHALKSMCLNIGAVALARRAAALEHAARQEGRLPAPAAVDALAAVFARTRAQLCGETPAAAVS